MKREQLDQIVRGLMNDKARPDGFGPAELFAVVALIVKGGLERPVPASRFTLSLETAVSDPTAQRVLDRLTAAGWLAKTSGKGRANSNKYMVLIDRLPVAEEIKRTIVSPAMVRFASQYAGYLKPYGKKRGKKRRFTLANKQRMAFCLQRFLDRQCAGDESLLRRAIDFALTDERYRAKALKGPHALRREFWQIVAEVKIQEPPEAAAA